MGAERIQTSVNLLPARMVERVETRRLMQDWFRVLGFVAVGTLIAYLGCAVLAKHYRSKIAERQRESAPARSLLQETTQLRSRIRQVTNKSRVDAQWRTEHSPLAVLQMLTSIKQNLRGSVQLERIEMAETAQNSGGPERARGNVTMAIKTDSTANSAAILERLRRSKMFTSVQLASPVQKLGPADADLRFSVRCEF